MLAASAGEARSLLREHASGAARHVGKVGKVGTPALEVRVAVVAEGVIGTVDARHAIVDPAGLDFIQSGSTIGAGSASKAVYRHLGMSAFPVEVTNAITKEGQAAHHAYGGGRVVHHVIHVVGPDFRRGDATWREAVDRLGRAYRSVMESAEALDCVDVVRLPVISGGTFAGKFADDCIPELTARAIYHAARTLRARPRKEYRLCIFQTTNEVRRYEVALGWAARVVTYSYRTAERLVGAARRPVAVSVAAHKGGAVGFARELPDGARVGLMVAGNSGRPGGGVGLGLERIPVVDAREVARGIRGEIRTQEESVVAEWLHTEARSVRRMNRLFRGTICGAWGQTARGGTRTIQAVDYTTTRFARDYADAWVVRGARLRGCTATLVFVAGPNASPAGAPSDGYGSMGATANALARVDYAFFRSAVAASVRAGLLAMRDEGVTHALVALVSCGIYAGPDHKALINSEFERLVGAIVGTMDHAFEAVVIVDRRKA